MRAFCAVLLALICVTVPATAQRQTCEPGCAHGLLIGAPPRASSGGRVTGSCGTHKLRLAWTSTSVLSATAAAIPGHGATTRQVRQNLLSFVPDWNALHSTLACAQGAVYVENALPATTSVRFDRGSSAPPPHHSFHVRGKGQVTATRAASMWTSAPQATKSATPGLTAPTSMAATPAPNVLRGSRGVVSRAARVWGHCPMALSFRLEVASFSPRCARAALCFFSWTPLR